METFFILKNHALVDSFFSLDNYVHWLVASKTDDGKLVQYEGDTCPKEKIDTLQLKFLKDELKAAMEERLQKHPPLHQEVKIKVKKV